MQITVALIVAALLGGQAQNAPPPATPPLAASQAPATSSTVELLGGTQVQFNVVNPISSSNANVGDIVPIVVSKGVESDGFVVIPKAASGQAEVAAVDRAGGNGHGGRLALKFDFVYSADGGKIVLSDSNSNSEGADNKGAASTATIATYVLLGPLGLFAHNFVHGRDVTLDASRPLTAYIEHTVHVAATQRSLDTGVGYDH